MPKKATAVKSTILSLSALLITSCDDASQIENQLTESCISDKNNQQVCECLTTFTKNALEPIVFEKFALNSIAAADQSGQKTSIDVDEFLSNLSESQRATFFETLQNAPTVCGYTYPTSN